MFTNFPKSAPLWGLALHRAMFKGLHNVKPIVMAFTILIHTNVENSNMAPGVKFPLKS